MSQFFFTLYDATQHNYTALNVNKNLHKEKENVMQSTAL
jgi:hypothetical protein